MSVDSVADTLEQTSRRWAAEGGLKAKLADELAEDAEFLRKLNPTLIKKRARGEAPTDQRPGEPRTAPSGPQLGEHPTPKTAKRTKGAGARAGGPNPFVVAAAALAVGIALAKWIDWRGHAHPRD